MPRKAILIEEDDTSFEDNRKRKKNPKYNKLSRYEEDEIFTKVNIDKSIINKIDYYRDLLEDIKNSYIYLIYSHSPSSTELDISNKDITGPLDLSRFVNLKSLNCSGNQITRLDSLTPNLEEFICDIDQYQIITSILSSIKYLYLGDETDGNSPFWDYGVQNNYDFDFKYENMQDSKQITINLSTDGYSKFIQKLYNILQLFRNMTKNLSVKFHMYECYDDIFDRKQDDPFLKKILNLYEKYDCDFHEVYEAYIKEKTLKQLEKWYKIKIDQVIYHGFKG